MSEKKIPRRADGSTSKRPRGRPRIHFEAAGDAPAESDDPQSPSSKRKTQVRLAQRAYRSRREQQVKSIQKRYQDANQAVREMWEAWAEFSASVSVDLGSQMQGRLRLLDDIMRRNLERVHGDDVRKASLDEDSTAPRDRDTKEEDTSDSADSLASPALPSASIFTDPFSAARRSTSLTQEQVSALTATTANVAINTESENAMARLRQLGRLASSGGLGLPSTNRESARYASSSLEPLLHRRLYHACIEHVLHLLTASSQVSVEQLLSLLRTPLPSSASEPLSQPHRSMSLQNIRPPEFVVQNNEPALCAQFSQPGRLLHPTAAMIEEGWLSILSRLGTSRSDDGLLDITQQVGHASAQSPSDSGYRKYKVRWQGLNSRLTALRWLKPIDVELYLRNKGIYIDGIAQAARGTLEAVVPADVAFGAGNAREDMGIASVLSAHGMSDQGGAFELIRHLNITPLQTQAPNNVVALAEPAVANPSMGGQAYQTSPQVFQASQVQPQVQQFSMPPPTGQPLPDPVLDVDMAFAAYPMTYPMQASQVRSETRGNVTAYNDPAWMSLGLGLGGPPGNIGGAHQQPQPQQSFMRATGGAEPQETWVKVQVDVDRFIECLLDNGFCLGVSPFFLKADVDAALAQAVTAI